MRFPRCLPVTLLVLMPLVHAPAHAQAPQDLIRLNQVGFYPDAPKVAIVVATAPTAFHVTTPDHADTVYTGVLGAPRTWTPASEVVRKADFTDLRTPGTYVVTVPGMGSSHPFEITERAHQGVVWATIRGYYYQRASMRLTAPHAGRWARAAGHPDREVRVHPSAAGPGRPAGTVISAPGGWYDAGDYNKYIVNSGITVGTLFMLYEHFPEYFAALDLNIPESGNGIPDLLDEVLWNLRWMLAMQDPADGGVYHKLTAANFEGFVRPSEARATRYVVQKSTAATLDFAAVTAMAARIYDDFAAELPGLADSCRAAARAAWLWALDNPEVAYDQNQLNDAHDPNINTGEYGDSNFADEFWWAATELYITTGSDTTIAQYNPFLSSPNLSVPGWPNVGTMAFISLAHHRDHLTPAADTADVRDRILRLANQFVNDRRESPYDMVMGRSSGDFYWGSNSLAANQGMILIQAFRLTGDDRYLHAALSNLDYMLGRNGTGYSFLTGYGEKTPRDPHHRPSSTDSVDDPVPGLLAGGPNPDAPRQGEECASYLGRLPATTYVDHVCSYATNEIAINWNAPMAYLAGALEALLSPTGLPTSIEAEPSGQAPARAELELANHPNPARDATLLSFSLPQDGPVTLTVYDVLGRRVMQPLIGAHLSAGTHQLLLDVRRLAGGAYLIHLKAGRATATRVVLVAD